jgi:thimet oligopeptidase
MQISRLSADARSVCSCADLFPTTEKGIADAVEAAKRRATQALEAVYASPRTFQDTAVPLDIAQADFSVCANALHVVKNTHGERFMRESASKSIVDLDSFCIDQFLSNKRLYTCLEEVSEMDQATLSAIDPEYSYWLEETLANYRRRGMGLPEGPRRQVVDLQKDIAQLSAQFMTNISEDSSFICVTRDELTGVPEGTVAALERDDRGMYILRMDYPSYFSVMKNCQISATRQRMSEAFDSRAFPANQPLLQELIFKRNSLARLLGYESYAAFDLDSKMSKSPEVARRFIDGLVPRLQQKWSAELQQIKSNLPDSVALTTEGELMSYDIPFCLNQLKIQLLSVSEVELQEFFPLDATIEALFNIYEKFFNIVFEKVNDPLPWWSDTVFALVVRCGTSGELLGHIVLDLFPRSGKYTHACCHSVVPTTRLDASVASADSPYSPSLSVVLANFPAPTANRPALFLHDDVETFFHEFGHAIHGIMGRSRMATFAGTAVKRDFVELPSQMLEEWLWEPSVLRGVSRHYLTHQPLPESLIQRKVSSQNAFSGRDSLRQLQFAKFSLDVFGCPFSTEAREAHELNTAELFLSIQRQLLPGVCFASETHFECAFGHLISYAAAYYGYMWSEVFAQDIFNYIRSCDGLLSPEMGHRYVRYIVGVGGGRDPNDMLRDFLGREPNAEAFFNKLGV